MTFAQIIPEVLKREGGYVNDPDDMGGETRFGISKRSYPDINIKELTIEKATCCELHRKPKISYRRQDW